MSLSAFSGLARAGCRSLPREMIAAHELIQQKTLSGRRFDRVWRMLPDCAVRPMSHDRASAIANACHTRSRYEAPLDAMGFVARRLIQSAVITKLMETADL
jgi:hypothetical protein